MYWELMEYLRTEVYMMFIRLELKQVYKVMKYQTASKLQEWLIQEYIWWD